jgi:alkylated DNA nucleotide flippase Atl1
MKEERENPYLEALRLVPKGETRTFAELAALAGKPGAARAAGRAVAACPMDDPRPWHRIVSADGSPSPVAARAKEQMRRLVAEGAVEEGVKKLIPIPGRVEKPPKRRARPKREKRDAVELSLGPIDWEQAVESLWSTGFFRAPSVFPSDACEEMIGVFEEDTLFERTIRMGPRGYGVGTYRYWKEPMPELAGELRAEIYARLRGLASGAPGASAYPARIEDFWRDCRAAGQLRASSIVLRYPEGGVNFPHRDVYGPTWFPYQAACMLSRRGDDYEGGEFVLYEERPGEAPLERVHALDQGDVAIFASRGYRKDGRFVELRHGMRTVTRGERFALGLVLHLAE